MKETDYYYCKSGLTREEYNTDRAKLDGFTPVENDWKGLFKWIMSCGENIIFHNGGGRDEGNISGLWRNHVMTILVEIAQKNTREYQDSFVEGRGTVKQLFYFKDLCGKFSGWIRRLDQYMLQQRKEGYTEQEPAMQAARLIRQRLEEAWCEDGKLDNIRYDSSVYKYTYYGMINGMADICRECDRYIEMIGASCNMDGSLSLLFTYIRNYCDVVEAFNHMTERLPDFYRKEILQVTPRNAIQDNTFLIIQPVEGIPGFTLPDGTAFLAGTNEKGTDLLYKTIRSEYITSMKLTDMYSVFLKKSGNRTGVYKQPIDITGDSPVSTSLFSGNMNYQDLAYGWMIESDMLVLDEGVRSVNIDFFLTGDRVSQLLPKKIPADQIGFSVWLSNVDGWTREIHEEKINEDFSLTFSFTIGKGAAALVACTREIHCAETRYPSVRILMDNNNSPYDWATQIRFSAVRIRVEVKGITNFTFYNELGEIDTTQPFYPFGIQAEQGAWFMFGNEEMGLKHLEEVRLDGKWKKLPPDGYEDIYKAYPCIPAITDTSFRIQTEFQKDGKWSVCSDSPRQLFQKAGVRTGEDAVIEFELSAADSSLLQNGSLEATGNYKYNRDHDGFFRVTLQEPTIGFGTDAYRNLFTSVMIHNSRVKEKKWKALPVAPIIPILADVELSYKASDMIVLRNMQEASVRLARITPLSENESYPIDERVSLPLLPEVEDEHQLYWDFSQAAGEGSMQIYLNLGFTESNFMSYMPDLVIAPVLIWEYLNENRWNLFPPTAIVRDETNGFTQAGFVEIELPEAVEKSADGRFRIRTRFQGDVSPCLSIQNVWLNCIQIIAIDGDGDSLPAGTIEKMWEEDKRVESISQPLEGFGGKPAEILSETSVRQSYRIAHRCRAVLPKDYESLLLEQFPEVEKANCLSFPGDGGALEVKVVVFCRTEGVLYFATPAWKLAEMQRYLSGYISPFTPLQVLNPVYRFVDVSCEAVLKSMKADKEKVKSQLLFIIRNYIALWIRKGTFPQPGQIYSYRELHSRIANHEDIRMMIKLAIDGKSPDNEDDNFYVKMDSPWIIPVPGEINIMLLSPIGGIDKGKIGKDFKIG